MATKTTYKYRVGQVVTLKIGERPLLHLKVLERADRRGPHYKLDWGSCGYHELLNTIAVPERVLNKPA
jgi:hypothetical protein